MGFIRKATKNVSKSDIKRAESGGQFRGLDAGGYEAEIIDVNISEFGPNSANAGKPRLDLELKIKRNWDGEKVDPEVKIKTFVGLISHWASGALNFNLFQFLKSLEDGWDYDEDEPGLDIEDEDDARDTLLGLRVNVQVGYRVRQGDDRYPTNVFNEIERFLLPEADLTENTRLGDYDTFKASKLTTVEPARAQAKSPTRDTDTKFAL